ncbi:hypothetical protein [Nocardiopsis quinghaiensis]|uniref:hypothetical protein n=1 Tax=Nocardiopsis quinghaiensis TaxID=464995 RepID=UPI00123BC889|nr:hypothetical protein [Nocardiopsis quinghaiensis]
MAEAWMPGAERLDGGAVRTPPGIGAPRAVWTVTESDPGAWSAREEARRMVDEERTAHLVWNPLTGEVVQTLAATRRSRVALGSTHQYGLHLDHGHEGRVCLVVAAIASREAPFTDGPMLGLAPILAWTDSWGVARTWHAGPPGREGVKAGEAARQWARGGHFGHDQVPGSCAKGPGRLDTARLLATGPPVEGASRAPRTRPEPRRSATT